MPPPLMDFWCLQEYIECRNKKNSLEYPVVMNYMASLVENREAPYADPVGIFGVTKVTFDVAGELDFNVFQVTAFEAYDAVRAGVIVRTDKVAEPAAIATALAQSYEDELPIATVKPREYRRLKRKYGITVYDWSVP